MSECKYCSKRKSVACTCSGEVDSKHFGSVSFYTRGCGSEKLVVTNDDEKSFGYKFVRNEDGECKFYKRAWWAVFIKVKGE